MLTEPLVRTRMCPSDCYCSLAPLQSPPRFPRLTEGRDCWRPQSCMQPGRAQQLVNILRPQVEAAKDCLTNDTLKSSNIWATSTSLCTYEQKERVMGKTSICLSSLTVYWPHRRLTSTPAHVTVMEKRLLCEEHGTSDYYFTTDVPRKWRHVIKVAKSKW